MAHTRPPAPFPHRRDGNPAHLDHGLAIHIEGHLERVDLSVLEDARGWPACIGHQDVNRAESCNGLLDEAATLVGIAQIGGDREHFAVDLRGCGGEALRVATADGHSYALGRKCLGRSESQPC